MFHKTMDTTKYILLKGLKICFLLFEFFFFSSVLALLELVVVPNHLVIQTAVYSCVWVFFFLFSFVCFISLAQIFRFIGTNVGRILSIAMIGGLPCAVWSIDILPGIWSICARCFVSTDRCAQCYDDVTIILGLHVNFDCLQWRETETHEKMAKAADINC